MESEEEWDPNLGALVRSLLEQADQRAGEMTAGQRRRFELLSHIAQAQAHLDAINEELRRLARLAHEEHGVSWAEIGEVLGVTRQAARQRFAR